MTRSFALLLISLGLTVSTIAYGFHTCQIRKANRATIDYAISLSQEIAARQSTDLDMELRGNYDLLKDASKESLFPLKKVFLEIETAQSEFQKGWNENYASAPFEEGTKEQRLIWLQKTGKLSDDLIKRVHASLINALGVMQSDLAYSDEDLAMITERFQVFLNEDITRTLLMEPPLSCQEIYLRQQLIRQSFYHRLRELLFSATSSIGCFRSLNFDRYYPVILSDFSRILKPGETKELRIGIGNYAADLSGKEVELEVNGQRLEFGREGVARYLITGGREGENQIELSATVRDGKTKEEVSATSLYTYVIEEQ